MTPDFVGERIPIGLPTKHRRLESLDSVDEGHLFLELFLWALGAEGLDSTFMPCVCVPMNCMQTLCPCEL